ncbi:hypothetical protein BMF94_6328, partial [Rhodotorula taiwanensis]
PQPPHGAQTQTQLTAAQSASGSKFRFLGKRSNSTSQPQPPPPALILGRGARSPTVASTPAITPGAATPKTAAATTTGPTFAIQQQQPQAPPGFLQPQQQRSNSVASVSTTATSVSSSVTLSGGGGRPDEALTRQLNEAIAVLKSTHAELIAAVQSLPLVTPVATTPSSAAPAPPSNSAATAPDPVGDLERPPTPGSPTGILNRSFPYSKTHTRQQPSRASSSRASFVSTVYGPGSGGAGGGGDEWFDAVAVPGEFVLDEEEGIGGGPAGLVDRTTGHDGGNGGCDTVARDGAVVAGTRDLDDDGRDDDDSGSLSSSSSSGAGSRDFEDAAPIVAEDDDEDSGDEGGD